MSCNDSSTIFISLILSPCSPSLDRGRTRPEIDHNSSQVRFHIHLYIHGHCVDKISRWLKQANLDTAELSHLKRVRKHNDTTSFLIASQSTGLPQLPEDLNLPSPYLHTIPASSALTPIQLTLKTALWPTYFTPRRKDEQERWCRGKAAWAWSAMQKTVQAAIEALQSGEVDPQNNRNALSTNVVPHVFPTLVPHSRTCSGPLRRIPVHEK